MTWTSLDDGLNHNPATRPRDLPDDQYALWTRMAVETASLMRYGNDPTLTIDDIRACTSNPRTVRKRLNQLIERGLVTEPTPGRYQVDQTPTTLVFHGGAALSAKRAAAGAKGGRKSGETRRSKTTKQTGSKPEATTEANASNTGEAGPFVPAPVADVDEIEARTYADPFPVAWQIYPKHAGDPEHAREKWDDIINGRDPLLLQCDGRQLLAAVTAYARDIRDQGDARYVPGMAKWLAGGCYMDHLPDIRQKPRNHYRGIDDQWITEHIRERVPAGTLTDSMVQNFWAAIKTGRDPQAEADEIIGQCARKAERSLI